MAFLPNQPHRRETTYDGEHTNAPVNVLVRSYEGEDDDGYRWRVYLPESGKSVIVYDDELSPAPDAPATVTEQIENLLQWGHPLLHAFVIEAILRYAEQIVENREQVIADMANSLVHGPAWVACAENAIEALGKPA